MTISFPRLGLRNPYRKGKRVTDLVTAHSAAGKSQKTPTAMRVWPAQADNGLFTIGILG
jgi:hypothetical protein